MILKEVELSRYRNYQHQRVSFSPGLTVIIGANGQGKTNLLESIQLLCAGPLFRAAQTKDLIQKGETVSVINGSIQHSVGVSDISVQLGPTKKWLLDGKPKGQNSVTAKFPTVLFSPESLSVIKSGPEARRNFIDETLASFSPQHFAAVQSYTRVLKQRNRILKDAQKEILPFHQVHPLLESLEGAFVEAASQMVEARLGLIKAVTPAFNQLVREIDPTVNVEIAVEYVISGETANSWSGDDIRKNLSQRAKDLRGQELSVGYSLVGPHKHDVRILHGGHDSRIWCSQGQQRALILSFKLARIVYHYNAYHFYPFLLLDDVLSELDMQKRDNLIRALSRMEGQIFVTSTEHTAPFSQFEQSVFQVRAGNVERL